MKNGLIRYQDLSDDLKKIISHAKIFNDPVNLDEKTNNKIDLIDEYSDQIAQSMINKLIINCKCNDGHSIIGQKATIKDLETSEYIQYTFNSDTIISHIKSNKNYEISINELNGYITPKSQTILSEGIGRIYNADFIYNRNAVKLNLTVNSSDGTSIIGQIVTVKDSNKQIVQSITIQSDDPLSIFLKPNSSYTLSFSNKSKYNTIEDIVVETGTIDKEISKTVTYTKKQLTTLIVNIKSDTNIYPIDKNISLISQNDNINTKILSNRLELKLEPNSVYILSLPTMSGYHSKYNSTITTKEPNTTIEIEVYYIKNVIYGFILNQNDSNSNTCVTYTDDAVNFSPIVYNESSSSCNYNDWNDTFIIKGNKPCLYKDGTVTYYLKSNDYSKKENSNLSSDITTGNDGDVMAEFKKTYYKWEDLGNNKISFKVANYKPDSSYISTIFEDKDAMYIGIYEASIESKSKKLRSLSSKNFYYDKLTEIYENKKTTKCNLRDWNKFIYINSLLILLTKSSAPIHYMYSNIDIPSSQTYTNSGTCNNLGQFGYDKSTGCNHIFFIENWYSKHANLIDKCFQIYNDSNGTSFNVSGYYIEINQDWWGRTRWISSMSIIKHGIFPKDAYKGSSSTYYRSTIDTTQISSISERIIGTSGFEGTISYNGNDIFTLFFENNDHLYTRICY